MSTQSGGQSEIRKEDILSYIRDRVQRNPKLLKPINVINDPFGCAMFTTAVARELGWRRMVIEETGLNYEEAILGLDRTDGEDWAGP